MNSEQLEFAISQYLDGTLPEEEKVALETLLETDEKAKALLHEYRRLDAVLKNASPLPAIQWDRLATRISDAVAGEAEEAPAHSYPLFGKPMRLALAASVLMALGIGIVSYLLTARSPVNSPATIVQVSGPQIESATGQPTVQIAFGPASTQAEQIAADSYAQGIVTQPSRVLIASGGDVAQDIESIY